MSEDKGAIMDRRKIHCPRFLPLSIPMETGRLIPLHTAGRWGSPTINPYSSPRTPQFPQGNSNRAAIPGWDASASFNEPRGSFLLFHEVLIPLPGLLKPVESQHHASFNIKYQVHPVSCPQLIAALEEGTRVDPEALACPEGVDLLGNSSYVPISLTPIHMHEPICLAWG